jgi:uncharacterized protein (TIGR03435 family)
MRTALFFVALAMPVSVRAQASTSQIDSREQQLPSDFEVASVKRNSNTPSGRMTFQASQGGRLTAENMPLRLLIQHAYGVRPFQISSGPSWIDSDRYDIVAQANGPVPEKHVVGPMLQSLLENRFSLRLHRQMKEVPILNLTQVASGKLTTSKTADCENAAPQASPAGTPAIPCHEVVLSISPTAARLRGEQANTGQLVVTLANILGRPVIDQTTSAGKFDLDVEVSLDGLEGILDALGIRSPNAQSPDNMMPSIFTALPQQLGLKLTAGRGPVEVLVIDHVERPSEN